jgi:hypothetical protein
MAFDARGYGPTVAELLQPGAAERIAQHRAEELFPGARSPLGALSGLYLYHDRLDESHSISQDLHTPEGSFWHGILHRREPDPGNAAYWFRRVGRHPVFPALRDAAAAIAAGHSAAGFRVGPEWDPFEWIDFWERARRAPGSDSERAALAIQRAEWELLFDYCARPAPAK